MAQDFAKRRTSARTGRTPARKKANQRRTSDKRSIDSSGSGLRLFGAGLLSGVFLSFLVYLGTLPAPGGPTADQQNEPPPEAPSPKPRFDFYNKLTEQTIELDVEQTAVEPAADVSKPRKNNESADVYLLQTGSFRQRDDADSRRAELLLLGLTPKVEESQVDSGRWYRVYLGPFESHAAMSRARSLTASQNIDTLLLKRGTP
jgi:cell division protein FtsN